MRKFFLLSICLIATLGLHAQDQKVTISSATATSEQNGEGASKAIDGDSTTFWHSQWGSGAVFNTKESVDFIITLAEVSLVDYVRYIPRHNSANGRWGEVDVYYSSSTTGTSFTKVGTYNLNQMGLTHDFYLNGEEGVQCGQIKFTIRSGKDNHATAGEIEVYKMDKTKANVFKEYFTDDLCTEIKAGVSSSSITDTDVKALVTSLQGGADAYKKFRVDEYKPHMTLAKAQKQMGNKNPYSRYENPTGVYLSKNQTYWVAASGIGNDPVYVTVKNWLTDESFSSYTLHNGLNRIDATTEGNAFVTYFTDNAEARNVKVHFINAPVRGYWDAQTMTNDDWKALLQGKSADDNTILMVQSEHVQLAYPISAWLAYCPEKVTELMELYEQVQWAQRDIMGLEKYSKTVENRQFFYATNYGFMAAGEEGAYCHVNSLGAIMTTDYTKFDFWGVAHEWGHNNQIPGFHWSGCGETTNNIYASWAQLHAQINNKVTPLNLRLEDEVTGVNDYTKMRGGRMQTYFEEGLRKGIAWQLQDGPDYHGTEKETGEIDEYDANGNKTGKKVPANSRNYDHFVKLAPFWQLNLWGDMAEKRPDIIPDVIASIRTTANYTSTYNTNGKQQMNWMKLACDKAELNLLPFFEKAGMLRPIKAYIKDYASGWNIITEGMINELKQYVKDKKYETPSEEINYINGHNYLIYKEKKALEVPETLGEGCTLVGDKVKVLHSKVQNAVAFETYNAKHELIRITMYGLGSDDAHSYTQVLFPKNETEKSAYIKAVGYDGTRKMIYGATNEVLTLDAIVNTECYTVSTESRGSWYAEDERLNGTVEMGVDYNIGDENQQFAFLKSGKGNYYLYSVAKNKFVKVSGSHTTLTDTPEQTIKFIQSTGAGKDRYPWVVAFVDKSGDKQIAVSTGYSPDVITSYNNTGDAGNMVRILIAGDFDATAALAKIKEYEESAKFNELKTLIAKYQVDINNANKGVGYLTNEAAAKIQAAITEAEKVTSDKSEEEIQAAIDALKASYKDVDIVLPEEGKFYVIESAIYANGLVYAHENNRVYWSTEKTAATNSEVIWQFEGTENGSLKLRNVHNNQYISELGWTVSSFLGDNAECLFTIIAQGSGVVFIKGKTDNFSEMHAQGSGTGGELVRYNTNEAGSASSWIIREVNAPTYTLSVTDAGWASLVLGFNATIPSGVKAYTVSAVAEDYATLAQVTNAVLPANTPVLIQAAKGDYKFAHTTESATVAGNLLQGKPYNAYVEGSAYVLANAANGVGLYKATLDKDEAGAEGTTHFLNNAGKAYLPASAVSAGARFLGFDFGTETGIGEVETEVENAVIYDLAGRRVQKAQKGLYIVNGKKMLK